MKNMKRSQKRCWKSYCSEPIDKIEHYEEALADNFAGWCMHHRREIQPDGTRVSAKELIDKGLYFHRPASELIFMRCGEHSVLHNKGKAISEESRQKIAEAHKGRHHSVETRLKMSESRKGKHHSAGTRQKMSVNNGRFWKGKTLSEEHRKKMSEARKGMLYWNNGISSIRSKECPGEGWKRGRLRFK